MAGAAIAWTPLGTLFDEGRAVGGHGKGSFTFRLLTFFWMILDRLLDVDRIKMVFFAASGLLVMPPRDDGRD